MLIRGLIFTSFLLAALPSYASEWTLNDVSILLPVPNTIEENDLLLKSSAEGARGVLLPPKVMQRGPSLSFFNRQQDYLQLRALAIRIDPCFLDAGAPSPSACRKQIRIVWQPILAMDNGNIPNTVDAAVHSFFDLESKDFENLLKDLTELRKKNGGTPSLPLGVHPIAEKQGLKGAFVTELHQILLRYIGEKNLTRVTFMAVRGSNILWAFTGFDFKNGEWVQVDIPRIHRADGVEVQTFINRTFDGTDFEVANLAPAPTGPDTFNLLMRDTKEIIPEMHSLEIIASLNAIYRIENPSFHTSETADCVSCHVAQSARHLVQTRFKDQFFEADQAGLEFKSPMVLTNNTLSKTHTKNLRAFGYFGREPAMSQRVINESAVVAEILNSLK